tara:strand:- start:510 stop:788 length:279 start_codon:yes stop_codon:yes gene_type:complete
MRPKKYSDSFIREMRHQKKTKTLRQIAEENGMTMNQISYVIYIAVEKEEIPEPPEFLSSLEIHSNDKKFPDLKPRDLERPKKRSFLDWLLGR